jgi:hypothetical protein
MLVAVRESTPSEEEQFFRQNFPRGLLRNIARAVVDTGRTAYADARQFDEARLFLDADVAFRRLYMERALRTLVLPPGFQFETPRTPSGSYVLLRSDRIVLTACTRDEDVSFVEPYRYRETLARGRQMTLFDVTGQFDPATSLYALLIYGGTHGRRTPSLAKITFPLPSGRIDTSIDLIAEFPEVFASDEDEAGSAEAEIRLRGRDVEEGGEGGE